MCGTSKELVEDVKCPFLGRESIESALIQAERENFGRSEPTLCREMKFKILAESRGIAVCLCLGATKGGEDCVKSSHLLSQLVLLLARRGGEPEQLIGEEFGCE